MEYLLQNTGKRMIQLHLGAPLSQEIPLPRIYLNFDFPVQLLKVGGIDPNVQDWRGNTPLHLLYQLKNYVHINLESMSARKQREAKQFIKNFDEYVKIFRNHGADFAIKNEKGLTPEQVRYTGPVGARRYEADFPPLSIMLPWLVFGGIGSYLLTKKVIIPKVREMRIRYNGLKVQNC